MAIIHRTIQKRSLVFPILFFSSIFFIDHWRRLLIFPCYSLELCIQMDISFLLSFVFCSSSFLSFYKASSDNHFAFCISFSLGLSWSLSPLQCLKPLSIVHQALCLSDLILFIYLSLPLYIQKGFRLYLNDLVAFPTFFNLSLNLSMRHSWSEPQSAPSLVFADCIELLHIWLHRN